MEVIFVKLWSFPQRSIVLILQGGTEKNQRWFLAVPTCVALPCMKLRRYSVASQSCEQGPAVTTKEDNTAANLLMMCSARRQRWSCSVMEPLLAMVHDDHRQRMEIVERVFANMRHQSCVEVPSRLPTGTVPQPICSNGLPRPVGYFG